MKYAMLLLQGFDGTKSQEASCEFESTEDVVEQVRYLLENDTQWRVITIMHIEDFPSAMQGAVTEP